MKTPPDLPHVTAAIEGDWAHGRFERGVYPVAEDFDAFLALLQVEI